MLAEFFLRNEEAAIDAQVTISSRLSTVKPVSIAILAMGGQGGGVLADWIVALAEAQGWVAQSTSVPGVAQRTGATIYYVEMLQARDDGAQPILSLMPTPGDVDVVIAAEFMEAGRSVMRGLVAPDKTVLIASTHRSFAVGEKEQPGDGIGDPKVVVDATDFAAKRIIAFDMETLALSNGSVISAALFGAFAAADVLPFAKAAFEATILAGGKGAAASISTFNAAYDRAKLRPKDEIRAAPVKRFDELPEGAGHPALDLLVKRIRVFPKEIHGFLFAGVKRLTDFQDPTYAGEYLDLIEALCVRDRENGGEAKGYAFTQQAAKYTAVAMAFDDVIRVAEIKVRGSRFERVRKEVGAKKDQIVYTTEYMHPRMEEVCGALPRRLGLWIEARPSLFARLDALVNKGRRVQTGTLFWFGGLYIVSGMRRWRRGTLRFQQEARHRDAWLGSASDILAKNYDLAVEVLCCRRLIKGYSDTHARGHSKFDTVMSALPLLIKREDGAAWLRRLRQAALLDESGIALDGAMKTVATI